MTSASCLSSSSPALCDQWLCVPQSPGILYRPRWLCYRRFAHTEWLPGARKSGERERRVSSFEPTLCINFPARGPPLFRCKDSNHCPLCHSNFMPGEEAWKAHLMGREGCKQNSRRTAVSQRTQPAQVHTSDYKLVKSVLRDRGADQVRLD
ncbi:nucleus accumbens-associated protein 1-like protein [Lates japonicus]|uniref:Nucleus accumbens-associated protein 1-like protein n=1 Tax=Lates japonicus TaxID=270547 RepID=A0AAD3ND69_LATJO|nr:nucleus accumbens-associated protein 1-like protein [Lates japonicus]